jgi:predicted AAA+ superfamily ATPase
MTIKRYLLLQIEATLAKGKVAVIYGARQTGKTTLARMIMAEIGDGLYLNCDEPDVREQLTKKTSTELKALIGSARFVIIDEAQRVENIGLTAKLIHDTYPEVKLLLTGSSSIDLANTLKEPLTGRAEEYVLYPLASTEVADNSLEASRLLEKSLITGGYPETWSMGRDEAAGYLRGVANNYLYRDAFSATTIYDTTIVDNLLRLLAYQVGNEVSYSELGRHVGVSKETVMRYIDLLEKAFIVFRLNQYRKNQRNEVGRLRKVYFYDLGIRNGLINEFSPLAMRDDVGALWENYCMVERRKYLQRQGVFARLYFWRSNTGQEIDLVEETGSDVGVKTAAYEFKFKSQSVKEPPAFATAYPEASFEVVSSTTLVGFLR